MKRLLLSFVIIALPCAAWAGKGKEARLQMEADIASCNKQFPAMRGNMAPRSRCIGIATLKRVQAIGANPQPTIQITNKAVEVWSLVDQGKMTPQEAQSQIQMLGAELSAKQSYDEQQQKRAARRRPVFCNAQKFGNIVSEQCY